MSGILTILKRIVIVIGIAVAFSVGLVGAIYLSLRSSETRVPDIVGKDRTSAENAINDAGLNFRVRATRSTSEAKPDTVLIQLPPAGRVVKVGQTVAVDISKASVGEPSTPSNTNTQTTDKQDNSSSSNTSSNTNANIEKKPTNRNANNSNANKNANANANRLTNRNQNGNTNRATNDTLNANATGTPAHTNTNLLESSPRTNTNRSVTSPSPTRRPPVVVPTP